MGSAAAVTVMPGVAFSGGWDGVLRAFSVQYHPEAAAGPHEAGYLFDRFCDLMESARA